MYAFSVIPRSELTYPQDLDAPVRFGIGYYPDYYNNRGIRHKLNGLIPAQHRSQAILAAQYSICTRFSKSSVRLFWCPFGSRGRVKALALLQKQSLQSREANFIFYAQGSAAFGVRTPVSRYCSHKNHFPSLPR